MDTAPSTVEGPRRSSRCRSSNSNSSSSSSAASPSPEFEFWIVGNPCSPQPQLLSADELFSDGLLLPLHLLHLRHPRSTRTAACQTEPAVAFTPAPEPTPPPPPADASISKASELKSWRHIFKVGEKKARLRERRSAAAEKSISIWPFSRSRSAGSATTSCGQPRSAACGRKPSSAPCSRSNSRGDSSKPAAPPGTSGRSWAASPSRAGGVHVGRSSPVWHVRRGSKVVEPAARRRPDRRGNVTASKKGKMLNLSVNSCIRHGCHVTCTG